MHGSCVVEFQLLLCGARDNDGGLDKAEHIYETQVKSQYKLAPRLWGLWCVLSGLFSYFY